MSDKKQKQLGMNPSTASSRLVKDILFKLICDNGLNKCFHCGKEMQRENFSIEHKVPWLDSEDPLALYFDLENISFSHLKCNCSNSRSKKYSKEEAKQRCLDRSKTWKQKNRIYDPEERRERYKRLGT